MPVTLLPDGITHPPDCACVRCAVRAWAEQEEVETAAPLNETAVKAVCEALSDLIYAWDTRRPNHPDHPATTRAWGLRIHRAVAKGLDALERAGHKDERL